MADKRTIKFEISVDADAKGVERFNKVLKELQDSAPIADQELKKVRQSILDFAQSSGASVNSLKAQETALKALQNEAQAGGPLWRQLSKDIGTTRQQLGELTGSIRSAEQAQKELNKAISAPIGNTFGKIADQAGRLKAELRDLKFRSDDYLRTLVRVKEIESVGSFNQGRLNTIASNQAFMGATMTRGYGASPNLPNLPDTIAGDSQRVSELVERVKNLDRGSENYLATVRELATAQATLAASQAQLNRAVDGGAASYARLNETTQRRDARLRGIAEYNSSGNPAQRRNDGFGDKPAASLDGSGRFIASPYRDGNYTRMGDAGLGQFGPESPDDFKRRVEPLVNAVESANADLIITKRNAVRTLVEEEARNEQFRQSRIDEIANTSLRAEDRRFKDEVREFDRRLEARDRARKASEARRESRRRTLRQAGGIATAVGVGGFFGGPEGLLGAATGAVLAIHLSIHKVEDVIAELVPHYGADCPVAVVYRASWPDERIVRSTLARLASDLALAPIERTAIILVGPVLGAAHAERLIEQCTTLAGAADLRALRLGAA